MISRITVAILALTFTLYTCFGQKKPVQISNNVSAKDFFLPSSDKNKVVLYTPDLSGKKSNDARVIYYVLTESNIPPDTAKYITSIKTGTAKTVPAAKATIPNYTLKYQIMDMNLYGEQVTGTEKQVIEVTNGEVKILNSVFNNLLDKNKPIEYTPPITLLKMPKAGQKITWTYTDRNKTDNKCTAEWWLNGIVIDGIKKRAIRVTTEPAEENKHIGKTMCYYVEGYGLWKTEYIDPKGAKLIVDQFDKLDYEAYIPGN